MLVFRKLRNLLHILHADSTSLESTPFGKHLIVRLIGNVDQGIDVRLRLAKRNRHGLGRARGILLVKPLDAVCKITTDEVLAEKILTEIQLESFRFRDIGMNLDLDKSRIQEHNRLLVCHQLGYRREAAESSHERIHPLLRGMRTDVHRSILPLRFHRCGKAKNARSLFILIVRSVVVGGSSTRLVARIPGIIRLDFGNLKNSLVCHGSLLGAVGVGVSGLLSFSHDRFPLGRAELLSIVTCNPV